MSKKTITIEVPNGLPDGWECCGIGRPEHGKTMHLSEGTDGVRWVETIGNHWASAYLIASRTETPADWAMKQPKLSVLASMMFDGCELQLHSCGEHKLDEMNIDAEECPQRHNLSRIKAKSGKWINA